MRFDWGINCGVIKNTDGSIREVRTPSGAVSNLYKEALALLRNEDDALKVWAVAYNDEYLKEIPQVYTGEEPPLDVVLGWMQKKTSRFSGLSGSQIRDIKNTLLSLDVSGTDIFDVVDEMERGGDIVHSSFYSESETNSLESDEVLKNNTFSTIRDIKNSSSNTYLIRPLTDNFHELSMTDSSMGLNSLGKNYSIPGEIVLDDIVRALGVMDSDEDVRGRLETWADPVILDRYDNDLVFRSYVDDIASSIYRSDKKIYSFNSVSDYNESGVNPLLYSVSSDFSDVNDIIPQILDVISGGNDSGLVDLTNRLTSILASHGIDSVGLSELDSQDVERYVYGLWDYINGDMSVIDFNSMSSELLSSDEDFAYVTGGSIVSDFAYTNGDISESDMFEEGYVFIGNRVVNGQVRPSFIRHGDMSIDEKYTALYESLGKTDLRMPENLIDKKSVPGIFTDYRNHKGESGYDLTSFTEDLKNAILPDIAGGMSEDMVLSKIMSGMYYKPPMVVNSGNSSYAKRYSYISNLLSNPDSFVNMDENEYRNIVSRLLKIKIREKANNSDEYNNIWRYVTFSGDNVFLDRRLGFNIDALDASVVNDLASVVLYKASADDYTLDVLSSVVYKNGVSSLSDTYEFKKKIYGANPLMIERDYNGILEPLQAGYAFAYNEFSDFIRKGDIGYMKISESDSGGIYRDLSFGIDDNISYEITRVLNNNEGIESFGTTDEFEEPSVVVNGSPSINIEC